MKKLFSWTIKLLGTLTLAGIIAAGIGFFVMGSWLQLDEQPRKADYILPLAGDELRLIRAAELFNQGYAQTILVSNSREHPHTRLDRTRAQLGWPQMTREQYRRGILNTQGVDWGETRTFGNGHISTVEEAEALREFLQGKKATLLVVTSPPHARRAEIILEDTLPDCDIIMTTTPEGKFPEKWWTDQRSAQNIVLESAKLLHYWLGGAFRSTDS